MSQVGSNFGICWEKLFFSILQLEGQKLQIRYIWWRWSRICGQIQSKYHSWIDYRFFRFLTFRPRSRKTFYFWTSKHLFLRSTCPMWPNYCFSSRFEPQKNPTISISRNCGHMLIGLEKGWKWSKNRNIFECFTVLYGHKRDYRLGFRNTMTLSLEPYSSITLLKKRYS